ncbi:type II secretion system F family protein [Marinactinospora rubrisoli]|uniref:Type II secretion system F family protein n=1 Tax=Marinactinospora rubrisoli TaxID=2715399 RepID=A0ABW2KAC9_9ACTN
MTPLAGAFAEATSAAAAALFAGLAGLAALAGLPGHAEARLRALRSAAARPAGPTVRDRLAHRLAGAGGGEARRKTAVVDLCRVLAAELHAGRSPGDALAAAAAELPPEVAGELAPAVAAAQAGDDPGPELRRAAGRPGAAGLRHLAACWQVASGTGSGLAAVVARLGDALAEDVALRQELSAQLAGPRTTALVLAALPAVGLVMASALGGRPLVFLLTTPAGLTCFAGGLALDLLGLWWTHRMVSAVHAVLEPE